MPDKRAKRCFGQVTKLPSGRYQARYMGPDDHRHSAPSTFEDKDTALHGSRKSACCARTANIGNRQRLGCSATVTASRSRSTPRPGLPNENLKPTTRQHYQSLIDRHLIPTFGQLPLTHITTEGVKTWHALMGPSRPTLRAHAYGLLRTILAEAERDELVTRKPLPHPRRRRL